MKEQLKEAAIGIAVGLGLAGVCIAADVVPRAIQRKRDNAHDEAVITEGLEQIDAVIERYLAGPRSAVALKATRAKIAELQLTYSAKFKRFDNRNRFQALVGLLMPEILNNRAA